MSRGSRRIACALLFAVIGSYTMLIEQGCGGAREKEDAPETQMPDGSPPEILSWRHRILPREEYERLVQEWEAFVAEHPENARAWVERGDALRYAGKRDEAAESYRRAFEIDSTNAAAITAYVVNATVKSFDDADWSLAHQRLLRSRDADPDYPETYYTLWLSSLIQRDEALAGECLRRVIELGDMPKPLLDYGYNMLIGAPKDAIVLTNGDNDTYPPLALQEIARLRTDVTIVNLSLLNTRWYIRYLRDHGLPIPLDDSAIDQLHMQGTKLISVQMQEALSEELEGRGWPRPICYAVTVVEKLKVLPYRRVMEGLLERLEPNQIAGEDCCEIDHERTRLLLDTLYRLDSITDRMIDWDHESAVARIGFNYVPLLYQTGQWLYEEVGGKEGESYLFKAVSIAAMHPVQEDMADTILAFWEKADPTSKLIPVAKSLSTVSK